MKVILIIICLAVSFSSFSQTKKQKEFVWPKPIKDSVYYSTSCDTLRGTIEYRVAQGKVIGDGIIVSCITWENHEPIYSARGKHLIDSFYKKLEEGQLSKGKLISLGSFSNAWGTSTGPTRKTAYIKTKDGYKRVDEEFIFNPYK